MPHKVDPRSSCKPLALGAEGGDIIYLAHGPAALGHDRAQLGVGQADAAVVDNSQGNGHALDVERGNIIDPAHELAVRGADHAELGDGHTDAAAAGGTGRALGVEGGEIIDDAHERAARGADRAQLGGSQTGAVDDNNHGNGRALGVEGGNVGDLDHGLAGHCADHAAVGGGQTDAAGGSGDSHAHNAKGGQIDNKHKVRVLVDRLHELDQAYKGKRAAVIKEAERAGLEFNALRRLAARMRVDPAKLAQREALDHQYLYLAGERPNPAAVPKGTPLGRVVEMLVDNKKTTVRAIAQTLRVSVGTAHALRRQASAFNVQSDLNMNKGDQKREAARMGTSDLTTEGQAAAESGSRPVMAEPESMNAPHGTSNVVSFPRSH
jgi:hypothetical protein